MVTQSPRPDATAEEERTDGEVIRLCGDDAAAWAAEFCRVAKKLGHGNIDEGWMIGWFANAIENSHDIRLARQAEAEDRRRCPIGHGGYACGRDHLAAELAEEQAWRNELLEGVAKLLDMRLATDFPDGITATELLRAIEEDREEAFRQVDLLAAERAECVRVLTDLVDTASRIAQRWSLEDDCETAQRIDAGAALLAKLRSKLTTYPKR